MYADRHTGVQFKPGSLGVALAVNGALIGALFVAAPGLNPFTPVVKKPPLETYAVPLPTEPIKPVETVTPRPEPRLQTPLPPIPIPHTDQGVDVTPSSDPYTPPIGLGDGLGTGIGTGAVDPPKPAPPLIVQPGIDPRFARDFQPAYPSEERRAEREGRVVVRVLIGTDGRVKQVERVNATSDAFWRATLDRALAKWRFTPGTRDGVPVETWKTMSLSFVLEN